VGEDRVTVGRGFGHDRRGNGAACAGTVFDDDGLLPVFCDLRSDQARERIGRPAGGEGDHEANRLDRIRLLFLRDRR
jgi:hypothetical protein